MNQINEYFIQAELSLAAYAILTTTIPDKTALKNAGMADAQADQFISKWLVVDQYNDATGVSATVFQAASGGAKYLAIRGTQGLTDYLADAIILNGTPASFNPQYLVLKTQVQAWFADGTLTPGFTVTGHSLGGYLAAGLVADFGTSISHAYLYNAPGNNSSISVIAQAMGLTATPDAGKITSLQADAGISPIAGLGNSFSPPIAIAIEDQFSLNVSNVPLAMNHSQQVLSDALALYQTFAQLDPAVTTNQITQIFKSASNHNELTLEYGLDSLRKIILDNSIVDIAPTPEGNRDVFFTNLLDLEKAPAFKALIGKVTITAPPTSATEAHTDFGTFLSLVYLTPFALKSNDAAATVLLQSSNTQLFQQWEQDNAHTPGQTPNYSDMWLADRAHLLTQIIHRNSVDSVMAVGGINETYQDMATGQLFSTTDVGNVFGPGLPPDSKHIIFGDDNANIDILGGSQTDHLYGGGGDDILIGNKGNDYLEGGLGSDIYIYAAGDGFDTILDSDGNGKIQWDGKEIKGSDTAGLDSTKWKQLSTTAWRDEINHITYSLKTQTDGSQTLFINKLGDEIRVDHWVAGNLGITLGAGTLPLASNIFNGDQRALLIGIEVDFNILPNDASFNTYKWPATNWADGTLLGGVAAANFNDVITATSADETINGLGGNDALDGGAGNDTIDGGIGDDLIGGGAGSDVIYGGTGNDTILSATGLGAPQRKGPNDVWQVHTGSTVWTQGSTWGVENQGNGTYVIHGGGSLVQDNSHDIVLAGDGDDRVTGGLGDDYIDGGLGNDALWGLGGNDVIDGGDGDDYILGDGIISSGTYQTLAAASHGNDILDGGAGADTVLGGGKNDVLFGGMGNDYLWGDDKTETDLAGQYHGNDYLDGGDGNDQLVGGGKDDTLIGGAGNDMLFGDDTVNNLAAQYHGNDYLDGGEGNDYLDGGSGDDFLSGGTEIDSLHGGDGRDYLDGGAGNDFLFGEAGNDTLDGGAGADQLQGGAGNDTYLNVTGEDTIIDTEGHNTIQLAQANSVGADGLTVTNYGDQSQYRRLDIALNDGETLKIQNAFFGTDATLTFANGDQLDLETLVGTSLTTALNLQLSDSGGKLYGGANADSLHGGNGDDILSGALGNDTLYGGAGIDTLSGGIGDDYLLGGTGKDTYIFNRGGGRDTIIDTGKDSNLIFGGGISVSDITLRLGSLELDLGNGDQVHIDGFDLNDAFNSSSVNSFTFADGTQLSIEQLLARGFDLDGTNQNDTITGTNTTDRINGLAGNDLLSGGAGNDTLDGGEGNDIVNGGANDDTLIGGSGRDLLLGGDGNDVYLLDASSDIDEISDIQGQNVIRFAADMIIANLSADVSTIGGQLALLIKVNGVNAATITYGWDNFSFEFADGARMTQAEFLLNFRGQPQTVYGHDTDNTLYGGKASDRLYGQSGNDTLWGGAGDDLLDGGLGSDNYHYRLGDGHDVIQEADDSNAGQSSLDQVIFGDGISLSDVSFYRQANGDLMVTVTGVASAITVNGWYTDPTNRVEAFVFAGGQQVIADTLAALEVTPLLGSAVNDTLIGTDYRDIIRADNGDDVLIGNGGNDDLYGETGSDTYQFSLGGGSDKVFEVTGETSLIKVTGFELSRLTGTRVGDDLLLGITNASDSLTLKNFYTLNHDWQVKDQSNSLRGLSGLLTDNETYRASRSEIERLYDRFISDTQDKVNHAYRAIGMMLQADGTWQTPYQLSVTQRAESYGAFPGYNGYISSNASYYSFSSSELIIGGFSVSTYSSDNADIYYSNDSSNYGYKNVHVEWGVPKTHSNSTTYYGVLGGYLYTLEEVTALILSLGVSSIENPYVYTYTPEYIHTTTTTTRQTATVLSVTTADETGFDINTSNPKTFFQLADYPTTFAVAASNADAVIDIITGGDSNNTIQFSGDFGIVYGGAGNDTLRAVSYAFSLNNNGYNQVDGQTFLDGGLGNDLIVGGFNDDILVGGPGNDVLRGESGDDRYYFLAGDTGTDLIYDVSYGGPVDDDCVVFGEGIKLSDLSFSWGSEVLPSYTYGSYDESKIKLFQTLNVSWQSGSVARIVMPRGDRNDWEEIGIAFFEFADGSRLSMEQMLASPNMPARPMLGRLSDNIMMGTAAADELIGFSGPDDLYGGLGSDILIGDAGDDWLTGGVGNDILKGGSGNDNYYFLADDVGIDLLYDNGYGSSDLGYGGSIDADTVIFDKGINLSNFSFSWGSTTLSPYNNDDIRLYQTLDIGWQANSVIRLVMPRADEQAFDPKTGIEFFEFADGSRMTMEQMLALAGPSPEHAPVINIPLQDQVATEDMPFSYTIPANALIDQDTGDVLSYSQDTWLDWLHFDANTRTFSGTPDANAIYPTDITVTAKDRFGASISDTFMLTVNAINKVTGSTGNDTLRGSAGSDELIGLTGSDILYGGLGADMLIGGQGNDILYGNEGNDVFLIAGNDTGYDRFQGDAGIDTIQGSAGDDVIRVNNFSGAYTVEKINGGLGTNILAGTQYNDIINLSATELVNIATIDGGAGKDNITGSLGIDTIIGGTGSDLLAGGAGDDIFLIAGNDAGYDRFQGNAGIDTIQGSAGDDVIRVNNFSGAYRVEKIDGGLGINTLAGTRYNDTIDLSATELLNISSIVGGAGNDKLIGSYSSDTLDGGAGNDILIGGNGNDTYRFGASSGTDLIQENDSTVGNTDVLAIATGIDNSQLWFRHIGNDLEMSVIGTSDKTTVKDWYLSTANHVEQFKTTDGAKTLLDSNVQNLVNAMAAFAPPAAGQSTLPQNYQTALAPVIAANWQ